MNDLKIKICGMREPNNIAKVAALNPAYMGFIFYQQSSRYVGGDFIMPEMLNASIKGVGVFVNESEEKIIDVSSRHKLDHLQLHGEEPIELVASLKKKGYTIIKAFSIDNTFDFQMTYAYAPYCDYFLFDTKGKNYGGNGISFEWDLLKQYDQSVPFFLSGGLSINNIPQVSQLKDMNLHALDINSGVERSPGIKDEDSVKRIMDLITSL